MHWRQCSIVLSLLFVVVHVLFGIMADYLPDPYVPVPWILDSSWTPTCIPIDNRPGCDPINLMVIFKHQSSVVARTDQTILVLPPDVYPPKWEYRNTIESSIIQSALVNGDTTLVRGRLLSTKSEKISYLLCTKGMQHQRSRHEKENHPSLPVDSFPSNLYKPGVKMDVLVNKASSSRGPQALSEPRRTHTSKPNANSLCSFQFQLRLKPGEYWYLRQDIVDRGQHNHVRISFAQLHRRMNTRTLEERQNTALLSTVTHVGTVQAISHSLTGALPPSKGQIYYNQRIQEGTMGKLSQAQELLNFLQNEVTLKRKRYVALFHEVTETSLLAVTKYDLKRVANTLQRENDLLEDLSLTLEAPNDNGVVEIQTLPITSRQDKHGIGEALHSIRNNLKVGKKVLLAIAWSREDERQLFAKFPEVMMVDVTMGTNSQGLPELVICCPGPDMRIYTPIRAFLPSQCQWVFGWIWGTAIPLLLGRQKLTRTQLVLSDGDCKIYNAFEEHRASTYPHARHGLCIFHLVTKPLTDSGYTLRNKDNPLVKDQIATFKHWIFSWMTIGGVESENEFFLSHKLLLEWLTSFKTKKHFPTHLANSHETLKHNAEELTKMLMKILNHKERWFFPNRRHLLHLQQRSTSALDGVFSTTKCLSGKKVTPNMSLLTSVRTQDLQVQTRMMEFLRQWQFNVSTTPLWTKTESSLELTKLGESLKQTITQESNNYYFRIGVKDISIQVLRKQQQGMYCHDCRNDSIEFCATCFQQSPIPRWRRIRTVSFQRVNDNLHAIACDCLHNDGYPCRHLAALTEPLAGHFIPRYHKKYISFHGEPGHEELTKHYSTRLNDRRFLINDDEKKAIMCKVMKCETETALSPNFWRVPMIQCIQRSERGMIPHQLINLEEMKTPNNVNKPFVKEDLARKLVLWTRHQLTLIRAYPFLEVFTMMAWQ